MRFESPLFDFIRVSQFGGELTSNDVDWDELYSAAKVQAVLGIVSSVVPEEIKKTEARWIEYSYRQMAKYTRYIHAESALKELLDGAGVRFVILKGDAAAIYYKDPARRQMGDIDFLTSDFDAARAIMLEAGYELVHESDQYARHISFDKDGVHFELHRWFSHEEADIERFLTSGMERIEIGVTEGHEFPMLPKLANGIVLLDHMRSHLKSGLGLRQIVDWMMYVHRELDDAFWKAEFEEAAREAGLRKLAVTATKMCRLYLGLPDALSWCEEADEVLVDDLMGVVLAAGNFGHVHAQGSKVDTVTTRFRQKGVFRSLQMAGEYNWKAYKKHHYLKPFAWAYQIGRYTKQGLKAGRSARELRGDLARSRDRSSVLDRLKDE